MADPDAVRWLLVGTGDIVRKRVGAALSQAPGSTLAAVCGRRMEAAQETAAAFGGAEAYDDLATALQRARADAVYIATPVQTHVALGVQVLQAGKHVLVEKPLGMTAAECAVLTAEAQRAGVTAGCAYYRRCLPRFQHARQVLASGALGDLLTVRMSYLAWYAPQPPSWRVAEGTGGPVGDMGCHMFDLVTALCGRARRIYASATRRVQTFAADESCLVLADWDGGLGVQASFHWSSKSWQHELEITGSEGRLTWRPFDSGPVMLERGREVEHIDVPAPANLQQPLIEDFTAAIRDGRPPAVPLEEATATAAILDAVRQSLASGVPVTL